MSLSDLEAQAQKIFDRKQIEMNQMINDYEAIEQLASQMRINMSVLDHEMEDIEYLFKHQFSTAAINEVKVRTTSASVYDLLTGDSDEEEDNSNGKV